jgi:hypothetical protein
MFDFASSWEQSLEAWKVKKGYQNPLFPIIISTGVGLVSFIENQKVRSQKRIKFMKR